MGRHAGRDAALDEFAARIRKLRAERGWPLTDLAAATGMSTAYLSRLERGDRQPSLAVMLSLARALGTTVGALADFEPRSGVFERRAEVAWAVAPAEEGNGALGGEALLTWGSGAFEDRYLVEERLGDATLNPEELMAASQATCAAMSLGGLLARAGYRPRAVKVRVNLELEHFGGDSAAIQRIVVQLEADVPDIDPATFLKIAQQLKRHSPIAKALASVDIVVEPQLSASRAA
jgi:transcriptional regulator with XRE-family HTH domain